MLLKERIKLIRHTLSTLIRSKCHKEFIEPIFLFCLKFLEFIQDIRFPMHKLNITIPRVIIYEGDAILIPSTCLDIERFTYIRMH